MKTIVTNLVRAFREAVADSPWMSERAKRAARGKLATLAAQVGYPDRWRSCNGLEIRADDLFGNLQRARQFEGAYKLQRVTNPVPNGEWLVTPQTVNAYYNPVLNEVVVPAAMLQPPLFDPNADDAANYGAIGAIVGHEIARGSTTAGAGSTAGAPRSTGGRQPTPTHFPRALERSSISSTFTVPSPARTSTER